MKMKTLILIISAFVLSAPLAAQKCLNMNILSLMSKLEVPGNAAKSFASCNTAILKENKQTYIIDYGEYLKELDTLQAQKARAFNIAYVAGTAGMSGQSSSPLTPDQANQMAEAMKNMTPDQQRAYAIQQATQIMQSSVIQDDPAVTKQVLKTYDMAVNQLTAVGSEFGSKYRSISKEEADALQQVPSPDNSHCPHPDRITELPACSCVNELEGRYFQKKIAIEDKYDAQKIALYQSYIGKIKDLVGQVDQAIAALHYGADLKSVTNQRMLFSAQMTSFKNAFGLTVLLISDIHEQGAGLYVNKVNCDKNVYSLSCAI